MTESLVVKPCTAEAARYAVEHWHYSGTLPVGKLIRLGVWEHREYIGCVLFGRGASDALGSPYGLGHTECCELARVALREHESPVSQIVSEALRVLRSTNPGMRLVVSFADPAQGHVGGIYQAMNWVYLGTTAPGLEVRFNGRWIHDRLLRKTGWGGTPRAARLSKDQQRALPRRTLAGKHRYVYSLDRAMRRRLAPLALPYPRAVEGSEVSRPGSTG